jgi:hypothetical protein
MFCTTLFLEMLDIGTSVAQKCDGFIIRCSFDDTAVNIIQAQAIILTLRNCFLKHMPNVPRVWTHCVACEICTFVRRQQVMVTVTRKSRSFRIYCYIFCGFLCLEAAML